MNRSHSLDSRPWISTLIILIVGMLLYAPSIGIMLFSDDVPHMQWLSNQHNGSYWLSSAGFPVYRPATFAAWDLLVRLLDGPNALVFHTLSILLHLVNGLLVGDIAALLTNRRRIGLMAGLLFVAFPFSYGAVILTAAQFHLWQTFGLIAGARLMLGWLEDEPRHWWQLTLAWLLIGWAIFQHENGVLAPALVGGIMFVRPVQRGSWKNLEAGWRRLAMALGPVAGLAIVYLVLRSLAIEADAGGLQLAGLEVKIGQTLQVIGFPLAALFRLIFNPQRELALILAWIGGTIILGTALLLIYWRGKIDRRYGPIFLIVLGIGWILIAMLPAWTFVPIDYLLGSVRLHYLASVGIAWMWAAMLASLSEVANDKWQRWGIGGLGLAIWLAIAAPFIWARQAEFNKMDAIYRDVGEISGQLINNNSQPHTSSLMVLNGPSNMSPDSLTFLLGSEGSVYLPDYVNLESLLWINGFISEQRPLEVEMRSASDISPPLAVDAPDLDRSVLQAYDAVAAVQEVSGTLHAVLVGERSPVETGELLADFGNGVILEDGELKRMPGTRPLVSFGVENDISDILVLRLDWHITTTPQPSGEVFVHLSCDGELLAQADGPPLGRVYPLALWQPGERWRDIRYLIVPEGKPDSCLHILVGLYDPAMGIRLTIVDGSWRGLDSVRLEPAEND